MFDIAFSELIVVALVALVVVGPARLPKLARSAGQQWGRLQRYVNNVKNEVTKDIAREELRQLQGSVRQQLAEAERSVQEGGLTLEQHILQAQRQQTPENPSK
jgi:sec-independent protein translocase protein TatB